MLEQLRAYHEMAEVLEVSIGTEMDKSPVGQKARVYQQHTISRRIDGIISANKELEALYTDEDNLLRDEIGSMIAPEDGMTVTETFYNILNRKIAHHDRFPNSGTVDGGGAPSAETLVAPVDDVGLTFSGTEVWGKYLDLNALHALYLNLIRTSSSENSHAETMDYLQYLDIFNSFSNIPASAKKSKGGKEYSAYLAAVAACLADHLSRTQPLLDQQELQAEWDASFDQGDVWASHPYRTHCSAATTSTTSSSSSSGSSSSKTVSPEDYDSVAALQEADGEAVRRALAMRGLKLGGTDADRAARLFAVKGLLPAQYPAKLVAKGNKTADTVAAADAPSTTSTVSSTTGIGSAEERWMAIARSEHSIEQCCEVLSDIIVQTRKHAAKQLTRTVEERMQEVWEEEQGLLPDLDGDDGDDDDDGEGPIYNPKNIPLGWDGKPIPFWMYKLHGLKSEFKCEICGDECYKGRRAFDRHFREARHAHGMRVLGIPNTRAFHDITSIEDALELWAKMSHDLNEQAAASAATGQQEYEDEEGNVYRA